MGTCMAPSMACLFMGKLEERMLASAPCRPWIWWCYIDDIFFIWTSDEESLTTFIDHINSFYWTIKFTSEYSTTETHFLDVTIRKEESGLTSDLYSSKKETQNHFQKKKRKTTYWWHWEDNFNCCMVGPRISKFCAVGQRWPKSLLQKWQVTGQRSKVLVTYSQ